jgi:carbonic anhydrase/acetyltransferase-like protein (isoleucine patch superfamily)
VQCRGDYLCGGNNGDDVVMADSAKMFEKILLGKGVRIGENAIIVGPTIIGNNVNIGSNAVVRASVIGPGVLVQPGQFVEEKLLTDSPAVGSGPSLKTSRTDAVLANSSQAMAEIFVCEIGKKGF